MSEMIDRAAEALFPRLDESYPATMAEARAFVTIVIEAMREPTQNILDCRDAFMKKDDALAMWRTMIDSALKDPPRSP